MIKENFNDDKKSKDQLLEELKDIRQHVSNLEQKISTQNDAKEALKKSEEQFRLIAENISDNIGITTFDLHAKYIYVSPSVQDTLGYKPNDLIGKSFFDFVHPNDRIKLLPILKKYISLKVKNLFTAKVAIISETIEYRFKNKHGKWHYLQSNINVVGENLISVSRDITKSKSIEKKLKQSESDFRQLFDNSSDAIYIQDVNGKFIDVNQGVVNMYDYPKEYFIGKNPGFLSAPGRNDMDKVLGFVKDAFDGKPQQFDFWGIRKNGEIFPKIVRVKSGFYMGQKVIITFATDITERYNSEKEKNTLIEQLQQAQKMEAIGTLAGGIAHDFNNILSAIMGYTELTLKNSDNATKVKKYTKNVMKASVRAKDMVKQILAFSRKNKFSLTEVFISGIIDETIRFLKSSLPATIEIKSDIEKNLNPVLANPTQINQILMNLCTNSAHAMKKKGGILSISLINIIVTNNNDIGLEPGEYQLLKVEDCGIGIEAEVLNKIFDPYFTTKNVGEGTGLGLAVVYGIIKGYGGNINVKSEVGKGTIVEVYFPVLKEIKEPNETIVEKMSVESGNERILFVDDEPYIAEMSNDLLKDSGYNVKTVTNSIDALKIFKSEPDKYDLLITDMTMPNMTGLDLSEEMHRLRPNLPIIICTGFSEKISEYNYKSMGVNALLMKPVESKKLLDTIKNVLRN